MSDRSCGDSRLRCKLMGVRAIDQIDPASPQAWRRAPFRSTFKAWAARRAYEILPDQDIDPGEARATLA